MANVTSAINKSIDNNDNDSAKLLFRELIPEIIRLYRNKSVSKHRANNIPVPLPAIEIKLSHGDLSVSRPRANSFFLIISHRGQRVI